jgi:chromosome partitioning protein
MGRIVAVVNQKGGVGKTTTAVNLAAGVAKSGRRVLLVDLDAQANASSGFGIAPQPMETSIYAALLNALPEGADILHLAQDTELDSLQVIPSGADLYAAEVELAAEPDRFDRMRGLLHKVKNKYDLILIDCPPSLGVLTLNALSAAHSVLIPMQCEYYALEGLSQLARTLDMVRGNSNAKLEIEGVLLTMFDGRNNLARQVASDVRRHFGTRVYKAVIPRNVRLSEAPSFGKPVILYDHTSTGGMSYTALAKEFIGHLSPKKKAAA